MPTLSFTILSGAQILQAVFNLGFMAVAAKLCSPEQLGDFYFHFTIYAFISIVVIGGVTQVAIRYTWEGKNKKIIRLYFEIIKKIYKKNSIYVLIFLLPIWLLNNIIDITDSFNVVLILVLASYFSGYSSIYAAALNSGFFRMQYSVLQVLEPFIRLACVLMYSSAFFGESLSILNVLCVSYLISSFVTSIIAKILFVKCFEIDVQNNDNDKSEIENKFQKYQKSFIKMGVPAWAQNNVDRWVLSYFLGKDVLGNYGIAYQLAFVPIQMLNTVLVTYFNPKILEKNFKETRHIYIKLIAYGVSLSLLWITLLYQVLEHFKTLEIFAKYGELERLISYLCISAILFSLTQICSLRFMELERVSELSKIKNITIILGIILLAVMTSIFGMAGLLNSLIIGGSLQLLTMMYYMRKMS